MNRIIIIALLMLSIFSSNEAFSQKKNNRYYFAEFSRTFSFSDLEKGVTVIKEDSLSYSLKFYDNKFDIVDIYITNLSSKESRHYVSYFVPKKKTKRTIVTYEDRPPYQEYTKTEKVYYFEKKKQF